tara:strand:+ start:1736 stop:2185 length:450 start_codon:yes stop_codon:yes gene_type:complete
LNSFLDPIRPAARAVILRDGYVLAQLKKRDGQSAYLTLPGGKQDPGETLETCVRRECAEEIGAQVSVGPLLYVSELYKPKACGTQHRVEFLFRCDVPPDYEPQLGPHPDPSQIETVWVRPERPPARFRPDYGTVLAAEGTSVYLGLLEE